MASEQRKALLETANELGIEFKPNVTDYRLKCLIAEAEGEPIPVKEKAPSGPAVKVEEKEDSSQPSKPEKSEISRRRAKIAAAKKRAFATKVVVITNKDKRDNDVTTTVPLSVGNQYFEIAKNVPLDMPVELETCLIKLAENTTMTLHKDEVVNGKRTGNKVPVTVKKFVISYPNVSIK